MTPRELGFRMPAEWEPHAGVFLNWPNLTSGTFDESARLDPTLPVFDEIVRALIPHEKVFITVISAEVGDAVRARFSATERESIEILDIPTREPWCRDIGPTFLVSKNQLGAVDWTFNFWGEKYPHDDIDNAAAKKMARHIGAEIFTPEIIFEGGAVESNGHGAVLTTESCILNPNRNPGLSKAGAEQVFRDFLGAERILWLPDATVKGDDTDGHIDVVTRFINEDTVLTAVPKSRESVNFEGMNQNRRLLEQMGLNVVTIPLPEPIFEEFQQIWVPPGYANFLIANDVVLAPVFKTSEDDEAITTLTESFPSHEIIPIDCRPIIVGQGGIHCLTQHIPAIFS